MSFGNKVVFAMNFCSRKPLRIPAFHKQLCFVYLLYTLKPKVMCAEPDCVSKN